jgi:uncharacterized protein (DUF736 family)
MATLAQPLQGQLAIPGLIRTYILGGNSKFTLRSKKSGERLTFRVKSAPKDQSQNWTVNNQNHTTYFVSVLSGPDNSNDYLYIGLLKQHGEGHFDFIHTRKSPAMDTKSFSTFKWFWNLLEQGCHVSQQVEFWHEGSCCRCGRTLTVPESIADGIGPECRSKMGG